MPFQTPQTRGFSFSAPAATRRGAAFPTPAHPPCCAFRLFRYGLLPGPSACCRAPAFPARASRAFCSGTALFPQKSSLSEPADAFSPLPVPFFLSCHRFSSSSAFPASPPPARPPPSAFSGTACCRGLPPAVAPLPFWPAHPPFCPGTALFPKKQPVRPCGHRFCPPDAVSAFPTPFPPSCHRFSPSSAFSAPAPPARPPPSAFSAPAPPSRLRANHASLPCAEPGTDDVKKSAFFAFRVAAATRFFPAALL